MYKYIFLSLLCVSSYAFSAIVYVDKDNISGMEDGLSWGTAFTKIQDGIDAAVVNDEVWVAQGVYDETRVSLLYDPVVDTGSLILKTDVMLLGGFSGTETAQSQRDWVSHETTIDGSTSRGGDPAYNVVSATPDSTIDGFTITGGNANSTVPTEPEARNGAGISNYADGLSISNCTIRDNLGTSNGIGIFSLGDMSIDSCKFVGNSGDIGGAVYLIGNSVISSSTFMRNSAIQGGSARISGISTIQDCIFAGNEATSWGGAIDGSGTLTIERNVFKNNKAQRGGALYLAGKPINIRNCIFWKNHATLNGGAIFTLGVEDFFDPDPQTWVNIFNSTFVGNTGVPQYLEIDGHVIFDEPGTGAIHSDGAVTIGRNVILWNNDLPEAAHVNARGFTLQSALVDGATSNVTWNNVVSGDPMFVGAAVGDFRIWGESPAVDAGLDTVTTNGFFPPTDDIIGTPRPLGAGYDIGAYEFDPDNPPVLPEGSGDSPCFIATAVYGTPLAGEIDVLRGFRDEWMLGNALGAAFTDSYYRLSPPLADLIARHGWAKTITRAILTPVIALTRLGDLLWVAVSFFVVCIFVCRFRLEG